MTAVTVLVLADTHLRTGSPRWLPDSVVSCLDGVEAVLHAGDVLDAGVLDRLAAACATVHAVLGNNDVSLVGVLPHTKVVELAGVRIGMIHDSGPSAGREARLHRRFPDCQVVVFGHSHEPVAMLGAGGQLLFNPGSATQRRRQPVPTFGLLVLEAGRVSEHRILPV